MMKRGLQELRGASDYRQEIISSPSSTCLNKLPRGRQNRLGAKPSVLPGALKASMDFLWAGIVRHKQTGGIVPSQRFLIGKMIAPVPRNYRGQIVELGAGNGALTLRLAERCPRARILAWEINPTLAQGLRSKLTNAGLTGRVEVITNSAENLVSEMRRREMDKADYVISGIPLGNLSRKRTLSFIDSISDILTEDGMYIQFQHSLLDRKKIAARFPRMRTVPVLLNLPPAVVYYAQKSKPTSCLKTLDNPWVRREKAG